MEIELFDVQTGFGGAAEGNPMVASAEDLLAEMQRLGIARALVREAPDGLINDVPRSNEKLFAAHRDHPRLVPCPIVVPATGGDLAPEAEQVEQAIQGGAGAAAVRPGADHWLLAPWNCDPLFEALQERRLPVLCMHDQMDFDDIADLAERFPELPFVLAGIGYRTQRIVLPLMKRFDNVHLSLGSNVSVHCGVEQLVAAVGAERLLFGTGFPAIEPMCGVTLLMYADIAGEERALIGAGNLVRLIEGVQR